MSARSVSRDAIFARLRAAVYVHFDDDWRASAVKNALGLAERLGAGGRRSRLARARGRR